MAVVARDEEDPFSEVDDVLRLKLAATKQSTLEYFFEYSI